MNFKDGIDLGHHGLRMHWVPNLVVFVLEWDFILGFEEDRVAQNIPLKFKLRGLERNANNILVAVTKALEAGIYNKPVIATIEKVVVNINTLLHRGNKFKVVGQKDGNGHYLEERIEQRFSDKEENESFELTEA